MLVMVELSGPITFRPGRFKSWLGGRRYRRVWWLCFAVAWWPGDAQQFGEACRNAEWVDA